MQAKQSFLMRRGTGLWRILTFFSVVGVVTCAIVNLAVSGTLSWAWYPLSSIAFMWLVMSAFLLGGKNRVQYMIGTACILIFPFLSILDRLTPVHGWARGIGYPVAACSALYIAGVYAILRYSRWNGWTRASAIVLGAGVLGVVCESLAYRFVGMRIHWSQMIDLVVCGGVAVLLFYVGRNRRQQRKRVQG